MKDSKIIQLLRLFSAKELREFGEFVASPFFNKQEEIRHFYIFLKKQAPDFKAPKIDRHSVFEELYPSQVYDDKKMNYLMSDLLQLAEKYIGLQQYKSDKNGQYCHVLSAYLDRNLDKHYQAIYRKAERHLQKSSTRNTQFYYQQYLLADIAERHFEQQELRVYDPCLQEVADYFDLFYLSKKLEHTVEMLDREQVLSQVYNLNLVDTIIPVLDMSKYRGVPAISIYRNIYFMLKGEKAAEHFEALKSKLPELDNLFSKLELKQFYLAAMNFSIRQIREGHRQYQQELWNLYLVAIDKKLVFENGFLSPWTFKNVVKLGLIMNRLDQTEIFIQEIRGLLEPQFRKDAYNFSFADLYFHRGNFDAAKMHLNQVDFTDIFYSLSARQMLLKIYFEQDEEEALISLIASFKIFLKRNQLISEKNQKTYENFIYVISKLIKRYDSTQLRQEIQSIPLLADRTWLLEQLK